MVGMWAGKVMADAPVVQISPYYALNNTLSCPNGYVMVAIAYNICGIIGNSGVGYPVILNSFTNPTSASCGSGGRFGAAASVGIVGSYVPTMTCAAICTSDVTVNSNPNGGDLLSTSPSEFGNSYSFYGKLKNTPVSASTSLFSYVPCSQGYLANSGRIAGKCLIP